LPNKATVLALIDKQTDRITCAEIDPEFEATFGRDSLQTFGLIGRKRGRSSNTPIPTTIADPK
jgi:hypothetical protein